MAEAQFQAGAGCGEVNGVYDGPPTLRDRIHSQRMSAERSGRQASRLREVEELLDRNPEVARILDLLEQLKES